MFIRTEIRGLNMTFMNRRSVACGEISCSRLVTNSRRESFGVYNYYTCLLRAAEINYYKIVCMLTPKFVQRSLQTEGAIIRVRHSKQNIEQFILHLINLY